MQFDRYAIRGRVIGYDNIMRSEPEGSTGDGGLRRRRSSMATRAMTPIDATWYHMNGRSTSLVTAILFSGKPLDFEKVNAGPPAAARPFNRFRQRVVESGISRRDTHWEDMPRLRHRPAAPSHRPAGAARPLLARRADQRPRRRAARSRPSAVAGPRRRRRRQRQRADHAHSSLHRRRHRGDGDLRRIVRHEAQLADRGRQQYAARGAAPG